MTDAPEQEDDDKKLEAKLKNLNVKSEDEASVTNKKHAKTDSLLAATPPPPIDEEKISEPEPSCMEYTSNVKLYDPLSTICKTFAPYDEVYSLDDLLQMKIIGNKVANWIKQNPLPEDDPLLLLEYRDPNVANRGNEIRLALIANGATEITPTVFQFATNDSVFEAQHNMMNTHTWAFYNSSPMFMVHRITQPGQVVPLPQAETISTKLVHSYSDSRFKVDKKFRFFRK